MRSYFNFYVLNFVMLAKTHTTEYFLQKCSENFVNVFIKLLRLKQYIRTSQFLKQWKRLNFPSKWFF